jgi:hypothetical protein
MSAARSNWGDTAYSVRESEIFSALLSIDGGGRVKIAETLN